MEVTTISINMLINGMAPIPYIVMEIRSPCVVSSFDLNSFTVMIIAFKESCNSFHEKYMKCYGKIPHGSMN